MIEKSRNYLLYIILFSLLGCNNVHDPSTNLQQVFSNPPESAKPWVLWYWIKAAVSKEGITADLEAMKANGIAGAHIVTLQNVEDPPLFEPPLETLTPEWYDALEYTFREAKRLGIQLAMHSCDGFTVAGGPWITPEMSMQKLTWSTTRIHGGEHISLELPEPDKTRDFYKDIAVYAYPVLPGTGYSTTDRIPVITSSMADGDFLFLVDEHNNKKSFKSKKEGWIQYAFDEPFTCRSIIIRNTRLNDAANRLIIQASNDGVHFEVITRLSPPRNGWQDYLAPYTHSFPPTTARYFRFIYSREGVEPGSEDMEMSKFSPDLLLQGLILGSDPVIHQIEGKNGSMWRIAERIDEKNVPDQLCIQPNQLFEITDHMDSTGLLEWDAPDGDWNILRIGHTSTGQTNYIGGRGLGLECDKMNADIAEFQFDNWFGTMYTEIDSSLTAEVLKIFYVDSWECGSQNWTADFEQEFEKRRGYALSPILPVVTGLPLVSAKVSEEVLLDLRITLDELINERFFGTMKKLASEKGCVFCSESVAPVTVSDNLTHNKYSDFPMGEFWVESPTHDKPNDMMDAISGAHIYGKNIVQAEAFTTLRMDWNEHPGGIKMIGDNNFAMGVNRFAFHVYSQSPWTDRVPGMTLNTVGLYFQRDQTWWEPSKAWMEYLTRSQALLQQGKPVVDMAVFIGEDMPRRGITPDRLMQILPGLMSSQRKDMEAERLLNLENPVKERPYGIFSNANTYDPDLWVDPLRGYKYDCFNKDVLLNHARVVDGRVEMMNGMSYSVLVIPAERKSSPEPLLSAETAEKLIKLAREGATIIVEDMIPEQPGKVMSEASDAYKILYDHSSDAATGIRSVGKGHIISASSVEGSLLPFGIAQDLVATDEGWQVEDIAWAHRAERDFDIYFISNQFKGIRDIKVSLRATGEPLIFNPVTGTIKRPVAWEEKGGRTEVELILYPAESQFIVFDHSGAEYGDLPREIYERRHLSDIVGPWKVDFDAERWGPSESQEFKELLDWSESENNSIRFYSGTATYHTSFNFEGDTLKRTWINLGEVYHLAEVIVNGKNCGIAWTPPYHIDISDVVKKGENQLEIKVTNSWKNRIIGDNTVDKDNPHTFTTAPFRLAGQPLANAGLVGPVEILVE